MMTSELDLQIAKRRTFAIISHPDAGKTTLTEKLLLFGGAIQLAGTVKSRKASRFATSDWMELEKQRGISVTTSVMQFPYQEYLINLLDTPGHEDFSEDTYRTLTAVDSGLMVIDAAKGVEARTIKLLEVCRLHGTPIMTFINKMDREGRHPFELLDEIESVLNIKCAPITWPLGMGSRFKGIYHLIQKEAYLYQGEKNRVNVPRVLRLEDPMWDEIFDDATELREEIDLIKNVGHAYCREDFLKGQLTPVFFGSAINNFGVRELLQTFVEQSPSPQSRPSRTRIVNPNETHFSGFVFKIQANMDPLHRDRIAFVRIVSGHYSKGMKLFQVRTQKEFMLNNALTFMAGARENVNEAWPGDIIGIHNYGTLQVGDSLTEGENLQFTGIPHFAPELFRRVFLTNPLKQKALLKGLTQLAEEGATQIFRPLNSNDLILGAVGKLQFDVVSYRLEHEYQAPCRYDAVNIVTVRWITCKDPKILERFKTEQERYLAWDGSDRLTYLAPSRVNLELTQEKYPEIIFHTTCEI